MTEESKTPDVVAPPPKQENKKPVEPNGEDIKKIKESEPIL